MTNSLLLMESWSPTIVESRNSASIVPRTNQRANSDESSPRPPNREGLKTQTNARALLNGGRHAKSAQPAAHSANARYGRYTLQLVGFSFALADRVKYQATRPDNQAFERSNKRRLTLKRNLEYEKLPVRVAYPVESNVQGQKGTCNHLHKIVNQTVQ